MRYYWQQLRLADWIAAVAALALVAFGLAAIYSVELSRESADFLNLKKQLVAVAIAFLLYWTAALFNYRLWRNYAAVLYLFGLVLLLGVLWFGATIRGTTGWFTFGVVSFQPVEFMKFALLIVLAAYFSERARRRLGWREIGESAALAGFPIILTLLQPDFGSAALLFCLWGVSLFFAGLRRWQAAILFCSATVGAVVGWFFFLADYQKARLLTFLHPENDPLGQGYNVTQAIIAVGAGGIFGRGLGFGSQSQLKFLPESQTDFIFAVLAEELGLVGTSLVLLAFGVILLRLWQLAARSRDDFTGFLVLSAGGVLFCQVLINVGMNLGLLPVTGVTLPLISYGGSSLIFTALMLGVAQSAAIRERQTRN